MSEHTAEKAAGLLPKYEVTRLGDQTGKHDDCRFFVLDPRHDPLAIRALRVYAAAANAEGFVRLAADTARADANAAQADKVRQMCIEFHGVDLAGTTARAG